MFRWFWRAAAPALVCMALTGCFLQPGKFDSTLDLHKDGSFTFAYKGQIYMLALSKLADMATKSEEDSSEFVEQACHDDDFNEKKCTAEDIAQQKSDWEADRARKQKEDKKNAEMLRATLGGIDPADPEAAQELADRLRHQAGWRSVNYVGDGLFEVDFSISSKATHDFAFPVIERFPMTNVFVMATRRADNSIRIEAPGFSALSNNPMQGAMGGMLGAAVASSAVKGDGATKGNSPADNDALPGIPDIDGTFRVITDGEILANNTDEGPQPGTSGKVLQWRITKRTQTAPSALVRVSP